MHVHFIGVAGTAMAPVAMLAAARGMKVTGSDASIYPPMSDLVQKSGIEFKEGFHAGNLEPRPDLVVVGNAVSRGNPELEFVLNARIPYISQAEFVYQNFIAGNTSIVITGTHGKTTTTSMVSWLLEAGGLNPGFLIGGDAGNFEFPSRIPETRNGYFVIEGDEYDTVYYDKRSKFFHYRPDILIINNIEFDHADIFQSLDDIKLAFKRLVNMVPANGLIIANGDDLNVHDVTQNALCPVIYFGKSSKNTLHIKQTKYDDSGSFIEYGIDNTALQINGAFTGDHNALNALAAIAVANHLNIPHETIKSAFDAFKGVKRRLELIAGKNGIKVYDDFAHHPTAISVTLAALRARHPGHRIIALLDPRSNTMVRKVFQNDLSESLRMADVLLCNDIYRKEKYKPEERLHAEELVEQINESGGQAYFIPEIDLMLEKLKEIVIEGDIIVMLSNGAFGGLRNSLPKALSLS